MRNVFLVGYMGVGKTTIGKLLGVELGMEFIDLDKYIENRYRKTIKDLFDIKGEEGFRKIENKMLQEVATFQNVLISTGGGTPCFFNNMDLMNKMGITVYLKASVDDLVSRLLASKNARPLIQGKSPYELKVFITHHLAERDIYYSQAMVVYEKNQEILLAHLNNNIEKVKIAKAIKEKIESFEVN